MKAVGLRGEGQPEGRLDSVQEKQNLTEHGSGKPAKTARAARPCRALLSPSLLPAPSSLLPALLSQTLISTNRVKE